VLPFLGALTLFAAALFVDDKRIAAGVLLVGVVVWTVFVQDHMTWTRRR
jgi:hypothetical protein